MPIKKPCPLLDHRAGLGAGLQQCDLLGGGGLTVRLSGLRTGTRYARMVLKYTTNIGYLAIYLI